jgi:hypothetical protein
MPMSSAVVDLKLTGAAILVFARHEGLAGGSGSLA